MGLRLYKIIPFNNNRPPVILPAVPSFSKYGYAKYKIHCNFSKALAPGAVITGVSAYAINGDGDEDTVAIIASASISTVAQEVDVTVQSGTVALSDYTIYVRVTTAAEQSELKITMTISADTRYFDLQMDGDLQMTGTLQMS